jgi:hypothetical protein
VHNTLIIRKYTVAFGDEKGPKGVFSPRYMHAAKPVHGKHCIGVTIDELRDGHPIILTFQTIQAESADRGSARDANGVAQRC